MKWKKYMKCTKTLKQKICALEDGRFCKLAKALVFQPNCENCNVFNYKAENGYYCAVQGTCIGVTLNNKLNLYLLWQLGIITEQEYQDKINSK